MRHHLYTETDIDAAPQLVWTILTDLDRYREWNPFVVSSRGLAAVGARLTNRLQTPDGKVRTFKPTVTVVEPPRAFEWRGHLGFPGIFAGRHRFELTDTPTGTRLVQLEEFSGILVRFSRRSLDDQTRAGFVAMNAALKARAEAPLRPGVRHVRSAG